MNRYLTINQLIAIKEYNKIFKYSLRKIAKEINSNKSTVQRTLILLNQNGVLTKKH